MADKYLILPDTTQNPDDTALCSNERAFPAQQPVPVSQCE